MPYDPEDEAGWNALPTASSNEDVDTVADSVGPLHTGKEPYRYCSKHFAGQQLKLVSEPEKVLSTLQSLLRTSHCTTTENAWLLRG